MKKYRNLVSLIDGTWNTVFSGTNVSRIEKDMCRKTWYHIDKSADTFCTESNYEKGPGTSPTTKLTSGAFALKLSESIECSYDWLSTKLAKMKGGEIPRIYLFGFSRGAYSVHVLSWLLHEYGVPRNPERAKEVAKAYVNKNKGKLRRLRGEVEFIPSPRIKMMGLWDAVTAPLDIRRNYHNGVKSPLVDRIYHAMAANEERMFFPVMQYKNANSPNIVQKWFSGVHGDIGGMYDDDRRLTEYAMDWMQCCARQEGIGFTKKPQEADKYDFTDMIVHSEELIDIANRVYHTGETLHESLVARVKAVDDYELDVWRIPPELLA